ncbi:MAG TPA: restriction endonuclease, partial [Kofleriaceae bacterium]|nr:restriction endonuclease [Kofleriaceae bacterium]
LSLPVLEQVAHVWLSQAGYRDIEWIKRVDRSAYASAQSPDLGAVLIGVRSGDQPVDRRGVGELRAGVAAKNLAAGVLLAARPLSGEALSELEKAGKPLLAMCGDALVTALMSARIGVQTAAVPVVYLDVDYFEELRRE